MKTKTIIAFITAACLCAATVIYGVNKNGYIYNLPVQTSALTTSGTPGTVTGLTSAFLAVAQAQVYADQANTDFIFLGVDASATLYPLAPGQCFIIPFPPTDLNAWNVKSATASQTYRIVYVPQ